MATGVFELDRDIICPCDYRDLDVEEYGSCFCCLYVDDDIYEGKKEAEPIPERRPIDKQINVLEFTEESKEFEFDKEAGVSPTRRQLYFCKVCGYVVFRDDPPYVCPICRAKKEMFSVIEHQLSISERAREK
jgi:rubrerythrin